MAGKPKYQISKDWKIAIVSFVLLGVGMTLDFLAKPVWFKDWIRLAYYTVAYVPVGLPVIAKGVRLAIKGEIFTEFTLMGIATIGAFYIGEYPEGVAVMLFYSVGELLQGAAVNRAKRNIKALLDVRPDVAHVLRNEALVSVDPSEVEVGELIRVKVGERVPLDGVIIGDGSSFNTAALTGESLPSNIGEGKTVLAGMVNESRVVDLKVTRLFNESSIARILKLVQEATGRKAKTELFIRRFAKVYTPAVVFLAVGVTLIPYFFDPAYNFHEWLYRALIFLVISCPCALVVAIPLGYFGGIGAGSRNGILFKGSSYLDRMTRVDTIVMDKTGTLTQGVFKVQHLVDIGLKREEWLPLAVAIESRSNHPIAKAIAAYAGGGEALPVENAEEIRGYGLRGKVAGKMVLVGNLKLMKLFGVDVTPEAQDEARTMVFVSVDGVLAGHLSVADELKPDSIIAIQKMHALNIRTIMLSGDRQSVVNDTAEQLEIAEAFGELLPEEKVVKLEAIKKGNKGAVAFVGDGINDAPVLAISDVGIAMGGLGSDAAIETADVVIQTDQPSKIVTAIRIGKATNEIVWQNIALAFGVKFVVLALGAGGVASMWEAVFADVGVALLAILNAIRIQRMNFG